MNKKFIYFSVFIGFIVLMSLLSISILIFDLSWWILLWVLLSLMSIGLIITIIYFIKKLSKQSPEKEEIKKSRIESDEAREISIELLKSPEYAEELIIKDETIKNVGEAGHEKTPIYHIWGTGYYEGKRIDILINMNNPKKRCILKDSNIKQIDEAIENMAEVPRTEEKIVREVMLDEFGQQVTRMTKVSQTPEQKKAEEKEQKEEEVEKL